MSKDDLKKIENRIIELQGLSINCLNEIKRNPNIKENYQKLINYGKELKRLKKELKNVLKNCGD